jgi:predicted DNA-binding transcriptional regulator AlpA
MLESVQQVETTFDERSRAVLDKYLSAPQVCARYGVSLQSLWRWLKSPDLNFPKPIYISRYRYFSVNALLDWERDRATRKDENETPR